MRINPVKTLRIYLEDNGPLDPKLLLGKEGETKAQRLARLKKIKPQYTAVELKEGQAPPDKETAVFVCKPMGFDASMQMPVGQRTTGQGRSQWITYLGEMAETHITGWENVVDQKGKPVKYEPTYMTDGTIEPGQTTTVVNFLFDRASTGRGKKRLGKRRPASSRKSKSRSGTRTKGRRTATRAKKIDSRQASK